MRQINVKVKPRKNRLDQFVAQEVKTLSRSKTKKLIDEGYIVVNNHQVDPSYKVLKGDKIKIEIPVSQSVNLQSEKIPLEILFEDENLLVINKQPGIVVHPTLDHPSGTVVNGILNHLESELKNDKLRPGIVHRLDKDTSGVLVVAKNEKTLENLKKQFKTRTVKKTYIALVHREVEKQTGLINNPIGRHPKFKSKFNVDSNGKEAQTKYFVLKRFPKFTLLELQPQTGRTHQLRVHLSHLGHPIVGDKLYGGKMLLPRQFLHASKLELLDPKNKKTLNFEAKMPKDLLTFLDKIEKEN